MSANYSSSANIKLKFDKTANLANISSLTSANKQGGSNFNVEGRYKKKNSDNEQLQEKKK